MQDNPTVAPSTTSPGIYSSFTQGGVSVFKEQSNECPDFMGESYKIRDGWVGWMGMPL